MKRLLKWSAVALGVLLLSLGGLALRQRETIVRVWDVLRDALALRTPEDVLQYIATHPQDVSVAAWTVGDEAHGVYLNADKPRPLASTIKVLVLADYAEQVGFGALRPEEPVELSAWEAYWLPGTDGGAHKAALRELRA